MSNESNRRAEGIKPPEDLSGKKAGKRNRSVRPESPSGNRPSSENSSGKRQKTNEIQTDYDSSHSDEINISIHAMRNIEDEDNEKNDLEKNIAIQEQDEDKEYNICLVKPLVMKVQGQKLIVMGEAIKRFGDPN